MTRPIKIFLSLIFLASIQHPLHAQDTTRVSGEKPVIFLDSAENRIHNNVSLSDFYEKLYQLRNGANARINIVQIGDSHIQADYLSGRVRQDFHRDFGNAGRGLIIPGRVARTNEPSSIATSSNSSWEVKRCVFPDQPLPIGIGGITLRTLQPNTRLTIRTINTPSFDYRFNKITLFFLKDFSSFNMVVKDSVNEDLAFIGPYTFEPFPNISTVFLPFATNHVTFQLLQPTPAQTQATLFGINLENGNPGVVYHAIGVNGAKFRHYVAARYFAEQSTSLSPDLFILSLGTNEALDFPYVDPQFTNQIDILIESLKIKNPKARFLLTTTPDFYRRKTRRNPGIEIIRNKVIAYADAHNIAYWDLYQIGGGKHSADLWRKYKLIQPDGVHFNVTGYETQGDLLYNAIMKGYDEYVQYRHP